MAPAERKIAEPPNTDLGCFDDNSIVFQPTAPKLVVEMGGAERVMFGTDYPHPADIPLLLGLVNDLPAVESAAITAIKGGNAARHFGL